MDKLASTATMTVFDKALQEAFVAMASHKANTVKFAMMAIPN